MVLVGQSMGHHTNQLLPSGLAGRGEVLGEVCGQHNDEDVSQELERRKEIGSTQCGAPLALHRTQDQGLEEPSSPVGPRDYSPGKLFELNFLCRVVLS